MFWGRKVWCMADVWSVSPSPEQTEGLWGPQSMISITSVSHVIGSRFCCK